MVGYIPIINCFAMFVVSCSTLEASNCTLPVYPPNQGFVIRDKTMRMNNKRPILNKRVLYTVLLAYDTERRFNHRKNSRV